MNRNISKIPHRELVALLQDGRINFLQFVMNGEYARDFISWCKSHATEPDNNSAEFFCEMAMFDYNELNMAEAFDYAII